jgi:hypothetical protein
MKAQLPVSLGWRYDPHETVFSLSHAVEQNSLDGERVSISNTSDNNGHHQHTPPVRQSMSELKLSEKFEEMKVEEQRKLSRMKQRSGILDRGYAICNQLIQTTKSSASIRNLESHRK